MKTELKEAPKLHPRVIAWNNRNLTAWFDARYDDDLEAMDEIEADLLLLATRVEERATIVAENYRTGGVLLFPEPFESYLEEFVVDCNRCLRDVTSLRPIVQPCPVRDAIARGISALRDAGGLRPGEWE